MLQISKKGREWHYQHTLRENYYNVGSHGLMVRVPGYRYRGAGLDSRRYQIF
jgi:hypothetical protein